MAQKVLLIGGTGRISTGIVKALLERSMAVTVYNRGRTPTRLPPSVEYLHGDRNDFGAFEPQVAAGQFDAVIDMVCFNADQARSLIRAFAGRTGHLIFCSTVCTYGNAQTLIPIHEGVTQNPDSPYGNGKLACERLLLEAHAEGKFPVTILRPSHTYGPGGSVTYNTGWGTDFIDRLRKGKPIIVSGDGHGLWQSAYCDDVGVGFAAAVGRRSTFGEAYNIVGSPVVTWDQYTQNTARAIGAPEPRIVHIPTDFLLALDPVRYAPLGEIFRYHGVYSNEKINRDIPEYKPATPFSVGMRQNVAWMDEQGIVTDSDKDRTDDLIVAEFEKALHETKAALALK